MEAKSKERPENSISLDRLRRTPKPVKTYAMCNLIAYALVVADSKIGMEPSSYEKTMMCIDSNHWKASMEDEMSSLYKNGT